MAEVYDLPGDVDELFANGEYHYEIRDAEQSGDNIFAMKLFIEAVGIPEAMIVADYETQIIVDNGERQLRIDSYGLGDFHLHGYDVTVVAEGDKIGAAPYLPPGYLCEGCRYTTDDPLVGCHCPQAKIQCPCPQQLAAGRVDAVGDLKVIPTPKQGGAS